MTRRRRSRWTRRKNQRTLLQIAILTTVLAFIALDSPAVRASVNATLVWLAIRGLILGATVLAIMWTYQFCRPPKVKRRTVKQGSIRSRRRQTQPNVSATSAGKSPQSQRFQNGAHVRNASDRTTSERRGSITTANQDYGPVWKGDKEDLIEQPMSGVQPYSRFYE